MNKRREWECAFGVWTLLFFSGAVGGFFIHPEVWPRAARITEIVFGIPTGLTLAWLSARSFRTCPRDLLRHWAILAMWLLTVLSCTWSVAPWWSFGGVLRLAMATTFALYFGRRFSLREVLRIVLIALAIMLLLSYALSIMHPSLAVMTLFDRPDAWRGVFQDKNALGFVAALSIISGILGLFDAKLRRWSIFLLLLAFPALLRCHSAGSLLVIGTSLLGVFLAASFHRLRSLKGRAVWVTAVLAFVLAVGSGSGSRMVVKLLNRDMTLTTRAAIWVRVLPWVAKRPLLGHGYRAFWIIAQPPIEKQLKFTPEDALPVGFPGHAHNGVLETAADLGALGVLLLGVVVLATMHGVLRWTKETALSYWPLAVVGAVVTNNLVETSFLQTRGAGGVGWVLFLMAAVVVRASATVQEQNSVDVPVDS